MNSDTYKIKTAVISVSDKTGIVEFAREISALGIKIFSTGGTYKLLKDQGIDAHSITELTNFPEILDGRVKTLHPNIHSGLLACMDNPEHVSTLREHNISSLDLIVVNLYPFEKALMNKLPHADMIENIDIGGPSMLRAAAKNYKWTAPVTDPEDYTAILESLRNNDMTISEEFRERLAAKVFRHTAYYDSLIAGYFNNKLGEKFPSEFALPLKEVQPLRYGENPHQNAKLYGNNFINVFRQIHGKELSYNNIADIDSISRLVLEFADPVAAIVKHTNPCGVATGNTLKDAYIKAFTTDRESPYGGIIAFNRELDLAAAEELDKIFSEVVIAPEFSSDALALLEKKKNRRLIIANFDKLRNSLGFEIRSVAGGFLAQETDQKSVSVENLTFPTKRKPTDKEIEAMLFGWKIVKFVKSNAIVYSASDRTLGVGCGQMSRVDSAIIAANKAREMGIDLTGCAVASDAFFPFPDALLTAVKAGATCAIEPGGSIRDAEVIEAADANGIAIAFTGVRHFRH